jgi:hypothetical protein
MTPEQRTRFYDFAHARVLAALEATRADAWCLGLTNRMADERIATKIARDAARAYLQAHVEADRE